MILLIIIIIALTIKTAMKIARSNFSMLKTSALLSHSTKLGGKKTKLITDKQFQSLHVSIHHPYKETTVELPYNSILYICGFL